MSSRRCRTQEVAGSGPASSTYKTPAKDVVRSRRGEVDSRFMHGIDAKITHEATSEEIRPAAIADVLKRLPQVCDLTRGVVSEIGQ